MNDTLKAFRVLAFQLDESKNGISALYRDYANTRAAGMTEAMALILGLPEYHILMIADELADMAGTGRIFDFNVPAGWLDAKIKYAKDRMEAKND